ncbi:hypothetical protein JOF41_007386 [Saccharothrix coeruleofusca]|uniref:hypothetical protein n=1 Tax=Saccharothrix coeruleofusca TaxID=33919 RepID=UPI001AEACDEE|nr:hypothetical protein [Saccharothrix coeruleofusca]MBP2341132.1 hypothetical protein [Saccharothrix coeruleofusca]
MTLESLLCQIGWSTVSLIVGFLLGRLSRNVETIATSVARKGPPVDRVPRRKWLTFEKLLAGFFLCLAIFTAAQGWRQDQATRRVAECTQAYSDGFAAALDERSQASAEAQAALDELMTTVGDVMAATPGDAGARQRVQEAVSEYLTKRAEARKQQQDNPFPPPPRDLCR